MAFRINAQWMFAIWVVCAIFSVPYLSGRWVDARMRDAVADLPRATLADLTGRAEAPTRLAFRNGPLGWFILAEDRIAGDLVLGLGAAPTRMGSFADERFMLPNGCADRDAKTVIAGFSDGIRVYSFCDPGQVDLEPLLPFARSVDFQATSVQPLDWLARKTRVEVSDDGWVLSPEPDIVRLWRRVVDLPWVWAADADGAPASLVEAAIRDRLGDALPEVTIERKDMSAPFAVLGTSGPELGRLVQHEGRGLVVPDRLVDPRTTSFIVNCPSREICDRLDDVDPVALSEPFRPAALLDEAVELGQISRATQTPAVLVLMRLGPGGLGDTHVSTDRMVWLR